MSDADRKRWDAKYAGRGEALPPEPSEFLREQSRNARIGPALDVACGAGRNALFLAAAGFTVDAIDISPVGLAQGRRHAGAAGLAVNWYCQDLLQAPRIPRNDYTLICMFHFVAPALLEQLPGHLAPGGVLVVEQHMRWHEPVDGPSERFRVAPGELRAILPDLAVLAAYEGEVRGADGGRLAVSRLSLRRNDDEA